MLTIYTVLLSVSLLGPHSSVKQASTLDRSAMRRWAINEASKGPVLDFAKAPWGRAKREIDAVLLSELICAEAPNASRVVQNAVVVDKLLVCSEGAPTRTLGFRGCTFNGVDIHDLRLSGQVSFDGCRFLDSVDMFNCQIGAMNVVDCEFVDSIALFGCSLRGDLLADRCQFRGSMEIHDSTIGGHLAVERSRWLPPSKFAGANLLAHQLSVSGSVDVVACDGDLELSFENVRFTNMGVAASRREWGSGLSNVVQADTIDAQAQRLSVSGSMVSVSASGGALLLDRVELGGSLSLHGCDIDGILLEKAKCTVRGRQLHEGSPDLFLNSCRGSSLFVVDCDLGVCDVALQASVINTVFITESEVRGLLLGMNQLSMLSLSKVRACDPSGRVVVIGGQVDHVVLSGDFTVPVSIQKLEANSIALGRADMSERFSASELVMADVDVTNGITLDQVGVDHIEIGPGGGCDRFVVGLHAEFGQLCFVDTSVGTFDYFASRPTSSSNQLDLGGMDFRRLASSEARKSTESACEWYLNNGEYSATAANRFVEYWRNTGETTLSRQAVIAWRSREIAKTPTTISRAWKRLLLYSGVYNRDPTPLVLSWMVLFLFGWAVFRPSWMKRVDGKSDERMGQVDSVLYSLDTVVPFDLGHEKEWRPEWKRKESISLAAVVLRPTLKILGWVLASLLVGALTGVLR